MDLAARIVIEEDVCIDRDLLMDTFHWETSATIRMSTLVSNMLSLPSYLLPSLELSTTRLLLSSLLTMSRMWRRKSLSLEEEKMFIPMVLQFITTVIKTFILVVTIRRLPLVSSLNPLLVASLFLQKVSDCILFQVWSLTLLDSPNRLQVRSSLQVLLHL